MTSLTANFTNQYQTDTYPLKQSSQPYWWTQTGRSWMGKFRLDSSTQTGWSRSIEHTRGRHQRSLISWEFSSCTHHRSFWQPPIATLKTWLASGMGDKFRNPDLINSYVHTKNTLECFPVSDYNTSLSTSDIIYTTKRSKYGNRYSHLSVHFGKKKSKKTCLPFSYQ